MPDPIDVKGCCPLDCQDTCAWVARVEAGRVVRVTGAPDHPFTRGVLCAKVNDYQALTYSSDRILHPLRRTGPKGSGRFKRCSWDDALDVIAQRFQAIVERHGAEAILPVNYLGSMGLLQRRSLMRLFHALGASRFHGSICGAAGNALDAEGHPRGFDPEEIADSRFILLWGANTLTTGHHHFHFMKEARRRHGARIVCIDPRRTLTAKACDEHVAIHPGGDAVLAAGLAHVMLRDGLVDTTFAAAVTSDLDRFERQVAPWTPARVTDACGVPATTVERLARELALARPAAIRCGIAPQQIADGEAFVRGLSALAILCGHWRLRGGGLFMETYPDFDDRPAARPDLGPQDVRSLDIARLGEHLTCAELSPPVAGLAVWNMNPAVDQPDAGRIRRGLAREDLFTVVLEHFMTDTARYADIVLPSTTQLEHFDVQGAWGHHYISANLPAIEPLGESRPHSEVMRQLARRMALSHPALADSDREIVESCLPAGVRLNDLTTAGWHKRSPPRPSWADGRARVALTGPVPLPARATRPEGLQLLTPKSHHFLNSTFVAMPRQRRAMKRPTLQMHRTDAAARGLVDGAEVLVANERGTLRAWVSVSDDIHVGVVALPGKWWDQREHGGALANLVTPSTWSPTGQPAYNETFVDVTPA